jgi:hypothetical protein
MVIIAAIVGAFAGSPGTGPTSATGGTLTSNGDRDCLVIQSASRNA